MSLGLDWAPDWPLMLGLTNRQHHLEEAIGDPVLFQPKATVVLLGSRDAFGKLTQAPRPGIHEAEIGDQEAMDPDNLWVPVKKVTWVWRDGGLLRGAKRADPKAHIHTHTSKMGLEGCRGMVSGTESSLFLQRIQKCTYIHIYVK